MNCCRDCPKNCAEISLIVIQAVDGVLGVERVLGVYGKRRRVAEEARGLRYAGYREGETQGIPCVRGKIRELPSLDRSASRRTADFWKHRLDGHVARNDSLALAA